MAISKVDAHIYINHYHIHTNPWQKWLLPYISVTPKYFELIFIYLDSLLGLFSDIKIIREILEISDLYLQVWIS
jgi:hypothetical protein